MQLIIPGLKSAQFLWGSVSLLHRTLFFYLAAFLLLSALKQTGGNLSANVMPG